VATTRNAAGEVLPDSGTGTPDSSLGATTFDAHVGGNGVFYSNCWIQAVLPASNYKVLSFREFRSSRQPQIQGNRVGLVGMS